MSCFSEFEYDPHSQSVVVGAGMTWDELYDVLEPHNMSVVGGRLSHVGVAGLVLGGGKGWLVVSPEVCADDCLVIHRIFLEDEPAWLGDR